MNEEAKKLLVDCLKDGVNCAIETVYESLAILFEEMAKHPDLTLQEVLMSMSYSLKMLVDSRKPNSEC